MLRSSWFYPASLKGRLFAIETNDLFPLVRVSDECGVREIGRIFDIGEIKECRQVQKRNQASQVFQIVSDRGEFYVRSAPALESSRVAAQCQILRQVGRVSVLKPLQNSTGASVIARGASIWICYPALSGRIFDGNPTLIPLILREAATLLAELGSLSLPAEIRSALPITTHAPEKWEDLLDPSSPIGALLRKELPQAAQEWWNSNHSSIKELITEMKGFSRNLALVHNDLQHANIVVNAERREVGFIDLEDLVFEDSRIAFGHCAFKVIRHARYRQQEVPGDCIEEARATFSGATTRSLSRRELFFAIAFRIVSDIYEIVRYTIDADDRSQLYDLEKRVLNLAEAVHLVEGEVL